VAPTIPSIAASATTSSASPAPAWARPAQGARQCLATHHAASASRRAARAELGDQGIRRVWLCGLRQRLGHCLDGRKHAMQLDRLDRPRSRGVPVPADASILDRIFISFRIMEVPALWSCHRLTLRISAPNPMRKRRLGADQPDHERQGVRQRNFGCLFLMPRGRHAGSGQRLPTAEGSQAASNVAGRSGSSPQQRLTRRPCSPSHRRLTSISAATASQCSTKRRDIPIRQ
jgi:hypothetical protein